MTQQYLIFGGGMMGEAIAFDLLHHTSASVHIIEVSAERITQLEKRYADFTDRMQFHQKQLGKDTQEIKSLLNDVDLAFGAIDYRFNLELTQLCIDTSTHFLDLGGNPDVVEKQFQLTKEAKEAGVTIIPDCGLAPGMVNVIAGGLIQQFETVEECHLRVGGLPKVPTGILRYQQVFSIRGLTNEYKENAFVLRDGKIVEVPSMTELEHMYFPEPFGRMEAFQTAGGTSSLPRLFQGKIKDLTYKTIRYPGHMQYFRFLLDFDLLSDEPVSPEHSITPREVVEQKLVQHLPQNEEDVVLIRIFVNGLKEGKLIAETWECIDHFDTENQITSMGRTTAYPISIIGQMIAEGIVSKVGVLAGEVSVPLEEFVSQLEERDITFSKSTEVLN